MGPRATIAILALDLGDTTGWARRTRKGTVSVGVLDLDRGEDEHPGARWRRARGALRRLVLERATDLIAWEGIVPGGVGGIARGNLYGLETQLVEVAADLGIETTVVWPTTLKKFATGRGNATKAEMRLAAVARWPGVSFPTHDAVDARYILEWATCRG